MGPADSLAGEGEVCEILEWHCDEEQDYEGDAFPVGDDSKSVQGAYGAV